MEELERMGSTITNTMTEGLMRTTVSTSMRSEFPRTSTGTAFMARPLGIGDGNATLRKQRELDMFFERLYEDNVSGKINDARFAKMSKRYEQEQGENAKKIKALRLELKKDESKRMDIDDFLETVRRHTDATTIIKRMVAELIDHIEVYHAEKQDGITNQRVDIHYNCIGAFDVPDRRKIPEADIIMETRKGVALSYAPEQVAV